MGYWILSAIAAAGFLASVTCHIFGWCHIAPPWGKAVFLLHVGIFPLWIPLCILGSRVARKGGYKSNVDPLLKELPAWVRTAVTGLFVYALLNFAYFLFCASQYSKHEVPLYLELRGFSGHWIIFYGIAAAGFAGLARLHRKQKENGVMHSDRSAMLASILKR